LELLDIKKQAIQYVIWIVIMNFIC
jgi:hypothetical protein